MYIYGLLPRQQTTVATLPATATPAQTAVGPAVSAPATQPAHTLQATAADEPVAAPPNQAKTPRFEFYDMLRRTEQPGVTDYADAEEMEEADFPPALEDNAPPALPADTASPVPATHFEPPPGSFMLQVASFQDLRDAEFLYSRLGRLGITALIQQVDIEGIPWYRVRIGPFSDEVETNRIRMQLLQNNLEAIIVRF